MNMNNLIGSVGQFNVGGKESFDSYLERVEFFFAANEVTSDGKKKALFLTMCGPETYTLIRNLVSPVKPSDKTLKELTDTLNAHLHPTPIVRGSGSGIE